MMVNPSQLVARGQFAVEVNSVLRNTYMLLGAMLAFAALLTVVHIQVGVSQMSFFVYLIGLFGLSFIVSKTSQSVWGLFWSFVFAGFLGWAIAPLVYYVGIGNPGLVAQALGLTAATFFALSSYTIVKRQDFTWLGSFIFISIFVILGVVLMSFFFDMSAFQVLISAFVVIVASALILYQTSAIVLGGERNYIIAANNLTMAVYLLFANLLSLLGIFGDD